MYARKRVNGRLRVERCGGVGPSTSRHVVSETLTSVRIGGALQAICNRGRATATAIPRSRCGVIAAGGESNGEVYARLDRIRDEWGTPCDTRRSSTCQHDVTPRDRFTRPAGSSTGTRILEGSIKASLLTTRSK